MPAIKRDLTIEQCTTWTHGFQVSVDDGTKLQTQIDALAKAMLSDRHIPQMLVITMGVFGATSGVA